jgi:hypothetical protein
MCRRFFHNRAFIDKREFAGENWALLRFSSLVPKWRNWQTR